MALTLIGYRSSGKSSVGRLLAERLAWPFVDADDEIERRARMSIADIFAAEGEAGFRQREEIIMRELLNANHRVVAAGGGAVLSQKVRNQMIAAGPVVYLRITPATAAARMRADVSTPSRRPALTSRAPEEEIESLMQAREPLYRQCATYTIDADDRSIPEVMETILNVLPAETCPEGAE